MSLIQFIVPQIETEKHCYATVNAVMDLIQYHIRIVVQFDQIQCR